MGVYLYSPAGAKEYVHNPMQTTQMVAAGYTFEPVKKVAKKQTVKVDVKSDDDIRQAAKAAGIGNWHNKKISNLVAELKALEA